MIGAVAGGWGFVIAAYAISALVLGGYAVRLIVVHYGGRRSAHYERE